MRPFLTVYLTALLFIGCSSTPPKPGAVFLILIDRSESVNQSEMRRLYVASLREIFKSVGHGDVVVAGWITDRSASELQLPVNETFAPFCPETDNPLLVAPLRSAADSVLRNRLAQITDTLGQILAGQHRPVMQSAILQSLELAQRVFANQQ